MTNTNLTDTDRTILAASLTGVGDYYATRRALARFCTEALAACAAAIEVPEKFSSEFPTWRTATRDESIFHLCGWTSWRRMLRDIERFERAHAAAVAAMPEALAELGAAL